jgi:hypothetical protein
MLLRLVLPPCDLARIERLRKRVPLVTKRTALAAELLRLGLEAAERDPAALVRGAPDNPTLNPQETPT